MKCIAMLFGNISFAFEVHGFTAKRFRHRAQGCRFGYLGLQDTDQFNRNAVASAGTTPSGLAIRRRTLPRVEATLGCET